MIKLVNGLFHNDQQSKKELCDFIMSTDRLSIGPECAKFEQSFADYQGRSHCVLFNSGSSANLALIQALINLEIIKVGEQAGFSALTWATNVMPLIQLGLKPAPIDVSATSLNVSSATLTDALDKEPGIKLLFLTNLLGFCDDIDVIKDVCSERGITLIEDNCESLGSVYKGTKLGSWGLASTFSFFVGHHMSTIEGGAVCTDSSELNLMLRLVRDHGWDRNLPDDAKQDIRKKNNTSEDMLANFTFYELGYNLRPTEITGFLGNQQLKYIDAAVKQRHKNFLRLSKAIGSNPDLVSLDFSHLELVSNMAMPLIGKSAEIKNEYMSAFTQAGVELRPLLGGSIPDQPFYRKIFGNTATLKNAHDLNNQGFYFPNNDDLTEANVAQLESVIRASEPVPA
jgi:CDP-4-dehydro-6-deoxyglucose reductase, E1